MASLNPEEILKSARNWNLDGDSKLLEFMQSISQTLESRCNTTKKNINGMLLKLDETNIALGNTTNKLLALQHSQFVENRVYEEDETIANSLEVPITEKKDKTELTSMESIQLAIDNGINMMNKCYEKVSLDLDDSDDDDDDDENGNINVAFRARDPHINQLIPFIIGSKDWKEKWHIGILESDDETDNDDEEQFSVSSDDPSLSVSLPSAATISGSESGSIWGLHPSSNPPQKEMYKHSSDDDLSSSKSDSMRSKATEKQSPENNYDKKLQQSINKVPALQKTIITDTKPTTSRNISSVLFPNDKPPEFHPIPKKRAKGLFDDSDSENENIIVNSKQKEQSSYFREQQPQRKTINLFNDEPPEIDFTAEQQTVKRPINLFADSDDDENDLFITENSNRNLKSGKRTNLFDDEPPIIVETKKIVVQEKIVEPKKINEIKRRDLFNDDDGDDDDFNILINKKDEKKVEIDNQKNVPEVQKEKIVSKSILTKPKITNLFDDEDEPEDFFETIMKSNKNDENKTEIIKNQNNSKIIEKTKVIKKIDNLFENNNFDDDFDIFNKKDDKPIINQRTQIKKMSLFDDDDPPIDDFVDVPKIPKPDVLKNNELLKTIKPSKGLFDDDDDFSDGIEDALFGTNKLTKGNTDNSNTTKIEDSIIAEPKKNMNEKEISKEISENSPISEGLVSSQASNSKQLEILQSPISNEIEPKIKEKEIKKGVVPDDFSTKPEVKKRTPELITKPKNSNLFGDAEDDDIFSVKTSKLITTEPEKRLTPPKKIKTNININVEALLPQAKRPSIKRNATAPSDVMSDEPKTSDLLEDKNLTIKSSQELIAEREEKNESQKIEEPIEISSSTEILENPKTDHNPSEYTPQAEPNPLEEIPPVDIATTISETPNTIKLFWDEPPMESESDDWLLNADDLTDKSIFDKFDDSIEKNKLPDIPTSSISTQQTNLTEKKNSSALNYNPIGLFDDLPPDDDDIIFSTPTIQKKTQIYYDDTESFLSVNLSGTKKSSSVYVMDEEPPPVDDFLESETIPKSIPIADVKGKDEIDKVQPTDKINLSPPKLKIDTSKRSSVADLIEARNRNKSDDDILPESPKRLSPPKKLNTNFNINVGALLPGAKPPSLRKETITKTSDDFTSPESSDTNRDEIFDTTPRNTQPQNTSDSNILTSLNKNRVKIQVKRRPSTRQGRREIYTKSQLLEDDGLSDENYTNLTPASISQTENKVNKTIDAAVSKSLFTDDDDFLSKSIIQKEKPKIEQISSIFNDIDDDDDLFSNKYTSVPSIKTTLPITNPANNKKNIKIVKQTKSTDNQLPSTSNLFSSDEDQTIFKKKVTDKQEIKTAKLSTITKPSSSVFPSDDEDDDSLFSSSTTKMANKQSFSFVKAKGNDKLFGDLDDDDNDDIFKIKSKVPPKKAQTTKIEKTAKRTINPSNDDPLADLLK